MHAFWRPTPSHDIGVDGQIEFLDQEIDNSSTGKIVAVQVKAGPSYFKAESNDHFKYYPSSKHRRYWSSLNIPIILVLHNPDTDTTIFTNVKPQLESGEAIKVSKICTLSASSRTDILSICDDMEDPRRVLNTLKKATLQIDNGKVISGIEFLASCLCPDHHYFEIRMARLHSIIELGSENMTIGNGQETYEFILRCSLICMGSKITESFENEFERQWYGMELVPDIMVQMTPFGESVVNYLSENSSEYIAYEVFEHNGYIDCQQTFIQLKQASNSISELLDTKEVLYDYPR